MKVDFKNAYNNVSWSFLLNIMGRFGFGVRWIKSIEACVCSTSISVMVNGSPMENFKMEKLLKQGDPLSPFLFT